MQTIWICHINTLAPLVSFLNYTEAIDRSPLDQPLYTSFKLLMFPSSTLLPYIALQSCSQSVLTNFSSNNLVITFNSDKCFKMADFGHRGLERNASVGRSDENPTIYSTSFHSPNIKWYYCYYNVRRKTMCLTAFLKIKYLRWDWFQIKMWFIEEGYCHLRYDTV